MELTAVALDKPEDVNLIFGQAHFIKTVEDIQTDKGRGVLGVVDGGTPLGVEADADVAARKGLLRKLGYKL